MTYTPALGAEQDTVLAALQRCPQIEYDYGMDLVDITGTVLDASIKPLNSAGSGAVVSRDGTAVISGRFDLTVDTELAWGKDIVAPYQLIRSRHYAGNEWQRFPLGHYVVTTPSVPLKTQPEWATVGYGKPYLLQSDIGDNYSAAAGSTYETNIATLMSNAGIPNVKTGTHLNPAVVNFPADWATKTIPSTGQGAGPLIYLCDDSNNYSYLDVINALLKASGMQPLSDDPLGRFLISPIAVPTAQAIRWTFSVDKTTWDSDFAKNEKTVSATLNTDAWNLPNKVIYIQTGLTFLPTHTDGSDGRYIVNNKITGDVTLDGKYYRPPVDQDSLGRVITAVVRLDASGQTDLIAQADKHYTDLYAQAETVDLTTAPWPAAWNLDVFRVASSLLPRSNQRKVQAQSWSLPLRGDAMSWRVNAVSE